MRNISIDVSKLGLSEDDTINISLIDSIGKPYFSNDMYSFNQTITIGTQTLVTLNVKENDTFLISTNYKLTIKENEFLFTVPSGNIIDIKPLDIITLIKIGCYKTVATHDKNNNIVFDSNFFKKLDSYLGGENVRFTAEEKSVFDLYVYFADNVFYSEGTNDFLRDMDEQLSKIGIGE